MSDNDDTKTAELPHHVQVQERNYALAKAFADSVNGGACRCSKTDAYAVVIDRQSGFSLTASWRDSLRGTEFRAWVSFEGKPEDADSVATAFHKIVGGARAL